MRRWRGSADPCSHLLNPARTCLHVGLAMKEVKFYLGQQVMGVRAADQERSGWGGSWGSGGPGTGVWQSRSEGDGRRLSLSALLQRTQLSVPEGDWTLAWAGCGSRIFSTTCWFYGLEQGPWPSETLSETPPPYGTPLPVVVRIPGTAGFSRQSPRVSVVAAAASGGL